MNSAVALTFIPCFVTLFIAGSGSATENFNFVMVNSCTCEGYNNVYECTVDRESGIIWTGTVFDCPAINNEIYFQHGIPNAVNASCNNGAISGRVVRAGNDRYTSQLSILVTSQVLGGSIRCSSDGVEGTTVIGSTILTLTNTLQPPPHKIHLLNASFNKLTFQWMPISSDCSAIYYQIISFNCGHCPNVTSSSVTTATCTGPYTNGQHCQLSIRATACIADRPSDVVHGNTTTVSVTLQVPEAPDVSVIPMYSQVTRRLTGVNTQFRVASFNISIGLEDSVSYYTIHYIDSATDVVCASATVPSSSCVNGLCKHSLEVPSSSCSSSLSITVTVSGTNVLGKGLPSLPVYALNYLGTIRAASHSFSSAAIIAGASVGSVVVVIITVTLICVIVVLIRLKRDFSQVIETLRDRERSNEERIVIYEETKQKRNSRSQSPGIDMEENRAYLKITPVK